MYAGNTYNIFREIWTGTAAYHLIISLCVQLLSLIKLFTFVRLLNKRQDFFLTG